MVKATILLIMLTLAVNLSARSDASPEALIGRVWLERAAGLLNSDSSDSDETLSQAEDALDIASEYLGKPGRDALYLEAELLLKQKVSDSSESYIRRAYILLGESLDDVSLSPFSDIVSFEDRAVLWLGLALQLKEYRTILNRYRSWPAGEKDSPLLLYAASRSALYLGLNDEAADLAGRGEALSVQGTDLRVLNSSFPGAAQPAFRAISIAAGNDESISTLDAAWNRWPSTLEQALRPWLLSGYIDASSTGNLMELLSPDMKNLLTLLSNPSEGNLSMIQGYSTDLALLRQVRAASPDSSMARIDSMLSGFTGSLVSDKDYDGYIEETIDFVNGKQKRRLIDEDQDGIFEWYITYEQNHPWRIQYLNKGSELTLVYDEPNYPALLSLSYHENNVSVDLSLNPGAYTWEAEGDEGFWLPPRVPSSPEWDEEKLWRGTNSVRFTAANPKNGTYGVSETFLNEGYPIKAIEKIYSDEEMEQELWIRQIIYEDGIPVAGRRSFRMDPDNGNQRLWELYERYENGKMAGLAWDPGMRGTPVYLRDWALENYLETQIWDLDADGWIDVRRFLLPNGEEDSASLQITEAESADFLPWQAADWSPWE